MVKASNKLDQFITDQTRVHQRTNEWRTWLRVWSNVRLRFSTLVFRYEFRLAQTKTRLAGTQVMRLRSLTTVDSHFHFLKQHTANVTAIFHSDISRQTTREEETVGERERERQKERERENMHGAVSSLQEKHVKGSATLLWNISGCRHRAPYTHPMFLAVVASK